MEAYEFVGVIIKEEVVWIFLEKPRLHDVELNKSPGEKLIKTVLKDKPEGFLYGKIPNAENPLWENPKQRESLYGRI